MKTESSQHATLDAFSPSGRENDEIGELGEFCIESRLMKMTSPSFNLNIFLSKKIDLMIQNNNQKSFSKTDWHQ